MLVTHSVASCLLKCKEKKAMKMPNQPIVLCHINSLFNAVDIHLAHTKLALRVADERRNKGGICYPGLRIR